LSITRLLTGLKPAVTDFAIIASGGFLSAILNRSMVSDRE